MFNLYVFVYIYIQQIFCISIYSTYSHKIYQHLQPDDDDDDDDDDDENKQKEFHPIISSYYPETTKQIDLTFERMSGLVAYRQQKDFRCVGKVGNVVNEQVHLNMNSIKAHINTCTFVMICLLCDIIKCFYNLIHISNQLKNTPEIYPSWFKDEFESLSINITQPKMLKQAQFNKSLINLSETYSTFEQHCQNLAINRKLDFDYKKTNNKTKKKIQTSIDAHNPSCIDICTILQIYQHTQAKPASIMYRLLGNALTLRLITSLVRDESR